MDNSAKLPQERMKYRPMHPIIMESLESLEIRNVSGDERQSDDKSLFPHTGNQQQVEFFPGKNPGHLKKNVGVVLSGGQAAGGHNVITGLFDALKRLHTDSCLFGFLGGPAGIIEDQAINLTEDLLASYRNQGGFDLIGSGRTKIETQEQFEAAERTVRDRDLDGLVIIGGDDSNTNAALIAEHFKKSGCKTSVVGVPKTIDGDLKNEYIEASFGFDTASKTYSDIIGNIARDALSAKKYYFFIKIMGRSASHLALECALKTHPNMTLIGEEIAEKKKTLKQITNEICDMICSRADAGNNYGVILIPEGTIEFIEECNVLIKEINSLLSSPDSEDLEKMSPAEKTTSIKRNLSEASIQCLESFPEEIQQQLWLERDPHGNVQVSKIETERLLIQTVKKELQRRKQENKYSGKFSPQPLFCGYEGRSCLPSNFDAQYCYSLGHVAALLINNGLTGYMAIVRDLVKPVDEWQIGGVPLSRMIHMEERKGKQVPVIRKALVDLHGAPFQVFRDSRAEWASNDLYEYPGPIQYFGPESLREETTLTLQLEKSPGRFSLVGRSLEKS